MNKAANTSERLDRILSALERQIVQPQVELDHHTPLELLMATILSAQCTDQRVNQVTPALFARYRCATDYATATEADLEPIIRSTGFYRSKAKRLIACGRALDDRFQGNVPGSMEELVSLPGVGRKTANVLLGQVFRQPAIVVDTHVKRVAQRLQLTRHRDPDRIEFDLQQLIPRQRWTSGSQRLLLHGRYVCLARKPLCDQCVIQTDCHWKGTRSR